MRLFAVYSLLVFTPMAIPAAHAELVDFTVTLSNSSYTFTLDTTKGHFYGYTNQYSLSAITAESTPINDVNFNNSFLPHLTLFLASS